MSREDAARSASGAARSDASGAGSSRSGGSRSGASRSGVSTSPISTSTACDSCLRKSHLIGRLAPRIADALARPSAPLRGLLRLGEEQLVDAVAGSRRAAAQAFLEGFDAAGVRETAAEAGIAALCTHDERYPRGLLELDDPPVVIYATCGAHRLEELLAVPVAAIVGTRRPSPYGREVAHDLGRGLSAAGVTVVSGLALGIDAEVHRGALEGRGRPLAVLACGADLAYPRRHRTLYDSVRERGAVVSELPPGVPPFRWAFPARNRIMAGLSRMTVVVEAGSPSGSLITTGFAEDLGREVGAVPGPITTWRAEGTNRLLKDGASPICGAADVLDALFGVGNAPGLERPALEVDPELQPVFDAIEAGEDLEAICELTGLAPGALRAALTRLELDGLVCRDGLGEYRTKRH
jgi:DNA processing protein